MVSVSQRFQTVPHGGITTRVRDPATAGEGTWEQLASASLLPRGSFGALLRACRHRALLSQEQLAARAELSERTVRDLEADRVRSPRMDTVRLLADALQLTEPERESWYEAARSVNHQRAGHTGARSNGQLTCADRRELAELRRENRRLREDVEILKRATAIFATAAR